MQTAPGVRPGPVLSGADTALIRLLFFSSGVAALIYEVLWMKELALLFGNTAQAAAATLAAFFLGLAAGGQVWGRRAPLLRNPLKTYAVLEMAVAVSAAGYFFIAAGYRWIYPGLFERFDPSAPAFLGVKFLLSLLVLFPPAFFMGGTLPVMSQFVVWNREHLGRVVSVLYLVNTLGAAAGTFLAGFYFPLALGFRNTYLLAMALTLSVSGTAFWRSRGRRVSAATRVQQEPIPVVPRGGPHLAHLRGLAFLSGLVTLALQVLWTRMFAQVLQNSVYTFSAVLVVFLLFLALGAWLANRLMRLSLAPETSLFLLLSGGAMLVALTPFLFDAWTHGLHAIDAFEGWSDYVARVFAATGAIMGPPLVLLGAVFPLLIKLGEPHGRASGSLVGELAALNTLGAIVGSLLAGFLILECIGLWAGIRLAAMVYLLAAVHLAFGAAETRRKHRWLAFAGILLLVSVLDTSRLPLVRIDPVADRESLLQVWEDSAGTVAVIRRGEDLKIKVNNYYTLGGTGSYELERLQGYLPLFLHPDPRNVYMLGLGTGITAGAALDFPLQRLVVTELVASVVTAAETYFGDYNNGLFYDRRARVLRADGRNYLQGTQEPFDVITGDLFVPWKAGAGSLYTLEHFRAVSRRLADGGLFMQWLPAYQLSRREFAIIAKTLLAVFPQVTVWRGDFSPHHSVIGLLAQKERMPLSPTVAEQDWTGLSRESRSRPPFLAHYGGNLTGLEALFGEVPMNTDDRPVIEFEAPITQRRAKSGERNWFAGDALVKFMAELEKHRPLEDDPYLQYLDPSRRSLPMAGYYLHQALVLRHQGKISAAKEALEHYRALLPPDS